MDASQKESSTVRRFRDLTKQDGMFPEKADRTTAVLLIVAEYLEQIRNSVVQIESKSS